MTILVAPAGRSGSLFVKQLLKRDFPVSLLTNSKKEFARLSRFKHRHVLQVNTADPDTWTDPGIAVDLVVIFETSPALTWRYVQYCRTWTDSPVHICTKRCSPIARRRELMATVHHFIEDLAPDRADELIARLLPERCTV